ncbi:MAG TPA: ComEC/Rec2 family competence protein [Chloroflexota bacterium]|nr:ComEC/Rec2 family competence protein [Chloroflexota bacterium]
MVLVAAAGAFIVGVIAGGWLPSWGVVPLLGSAGLLATAVPLRGRAAAAVLLCLAAALVGVWRSPHSGPVTPHDLAYYNGRVLQVTGQVDAEPDIRDTGANYEIAASAVTLTTRTVSIAGKVTVHTTRAVRLEYGDRVTLSGTLQEPANSAAVPYRDILARRGIGSEMRYPRIVDSGPASTGRLGWLVPFRQHLEAQIDRWLPEPEAALLIAIALGARSASLGDLAPVLIATGLIHFIAISGIKVAIVAGIVHSVARKSGNRLLALAAATGTLWTYVLVTGDTASGIRSAAMWTLVFLAWYLGRSTVTIVSLALVAALMVGLDPSLLSDTGFQMSTIGTFGIVALSPAAASLVRFIPSPFREALSVTLAAQIATLPVVILGFHVVAVSGPVANMLVLPLLPALVVLGFALGALGTVGTVAAPLAAVAYALLHAVILVSTELSQLPAALPVTSLPATLTGAYYLALAGIAARLLGRASWNPLGRRPAHLTESALALVAGSSLLTGTLAFGSSGPVDRVRWLGSGSAIVIRSGGMTAVVDGSRQPLRLLEQIAAVVPFDDRTIDLVIVDDARANSVTGLLELLNHYAVSEVLDTGVEYTSSTYAAWRAELRRRHIPVYALRTGARVTLGDIRIEALGPDALYPKPQDSAGLLRLTVGGRRVVLAGDASAREQTEAVFRSIDLPADALVCGSAPCAAAFLQAVHPRLVYGPAPITSGARSIALPAASGMDIRP